MAMLNNQMVVPFPFPIEIEDFPHGFPTEPLFSHDGPIFSHESPIVFPYNPYLTHIIPYICVDIPYITGFQHPLNPHTHKKNFNRTGKYWWPLMVYYIHKYYYPLVN